MKLQVLRLQLLQLQHGGAARSGVLSERTVLSFRSRAAAFSRAAWAAPTADRVAG